MFERPGISLHDVARFQRAEFEHYVSYVRWVCNPQNWPIFRLEVRDAVNAAFGLNDDHDVVLGATLDVIDDIRRDCDPTDHWSEFMEALWARRHEIRPDLY